MIRKVIWFLVWVSYCALTALVLWAFGADISKQGFGLGMLILGSFFWGIATLICANKEDDSK